MSVQYIPVNEVPDQVPSLVSKSKWWSKFWLKVCIVLLIVVIVMSVSSFWFLKSQMPTNGTTISWSDCGSEGTEVQSVSVHPSPIRVPGNLSIGASVKLSRGLRGSPPARIRIMKFVYLFWYKVPCNDGFGSCDYEDFCSLWPFYTSCPPAFKDNGIPCSCPLPAGSYSLPEQDMVQIYRDESIPAWLESGSYWARIQIFDPDSKDGDFMCNELYLKVAAQ